MNMSRRQFVSCTAGAMLPLHLRPRDRPVPVLLDLQRHCSLRESLAGYESALAGRFARVDPNSVPSCSRLIVPAALEIPEAAVRAIATCLQAGGTVVLESGAGFVGAAEFRAHRSLLRDSLQIHLDTPVHLWPRHTPYIDYTWPAPAKLRDFSRAVPLARQAGDIIAWVDDLPVALRRRLGSGTLIFLGSPLGPALWAGEVEARRWLLDVFAASTCSRIRFQ